MDFAALLRDTFPVHSETFALELVGEPVVGAEEEVLRFVREDPSGRLRGTFRTLLWEVDRGVRSIRDIKEQEVLVLHAEHREDPRIPAYLAGWAAALQVLFDRHAELVASIPAEPESPSLHLTHRLPLAPAPSVDPATSRLLNRFEASLPGDFVHPDVLGLRRASTADDFTDALLTSKKRLGSFVLG
ncbi:MAG: hypothetical protein R3B09_09235 [Nannocystaceae bacterium]